MNVEQIFDQSARLIGLAWGIHQPFRDYVERMTDGVLQLQGAAQLLDTGEILFPLEAVDAQDQTLRFGGGAVFQGHRGMMAVPVDQPWLEFLDEQVFLTIIDPFDPTTRMSLVEVDFNGRDQARTALSDAGTDLFMGNYKNNTQFDPIRIIWAERDLT